MKTEYEIQKAMFVIKSELAELAKSPSVTTSHTPMTSMAYCRKYDILKTLEWVLQ